MVGIAEAAQLATFLKTAGEITKTMIGLRDAQTFQAKVVELNSVIISAQQSALSAQIDQSALLERVRDLEKEVSDVKAWDGEKQRYELHEVAAGGFAYVLKEIESGHASPHKICVYCYEQRKKSLLQRSANSAGRAILRCYACQAEVRLFTDEPMPKRIIPEDRICPYCSGEMKLLSETNHPQLGIVGVKIHRLKCQQPDCGKETTRDYAPKG